ncbi:MAG: DUF6922 domain-containing protein [Syntrophomonadaceae bacterium]|jgi:hypothetical protein|nr:hypothetical protein [Bacillota bacterium]NLP23264.1 hypothetical protein [Syntrophomonadaceae bacterium]
MNPSVLRSRKHELLKFRAIFWDTEIEKIDLEVNKSKIIERIINFGDEHAYKWLWKVYSEETIRSEVKSNKNIDKKAAHMLANVLGIPKEEIICLKNAWIKF